MLVRKFYFYLWEEQTSTNWKSRFGSTENTSLYRGHILEKRRYIQQLSMVFLKIPLEWKENLVRKKLLIVKTPDFSKRPPPKLGCAFILYTAETSKEFLLPGLSWIAPQDFPIKLHYCISHFPASGTACGDISQMHQEKRTKLSKSCCLIYQKSRSYFWHMWPREYPTVCPAGHKLGVVAPFTSTAGSGRGHLPTI